MANTDNMLSLFLSFWPFRLQQGQVSMCSGWTRHVWLMTPKNQDDWRQQQNHLVSHSVSWNTLAAACLCLRWLNFCCLCQFKFLNCLERGRQHSSVLSFVFGLVPRDLPTVGACWRCCRRLGTELKRGYPVSRETCSVVLWLCVTSVSPALTKKAITGIHLRYQSTIVAAATAQFLSWH